MNWAGPARPRRSSRKNGSRPGRAAQRRDGTDWDEDWKQWATGLAPPPWAQTILDITPRGFTGHEHVDEMGIIHMNGRIYDAHLGRFLQADPFVEDSTTLNRYTYVHNNPLSLTDPSGFFSLGKWFKIAAVVAISVYTGGLAAGQFAFFGTTLAGGQAFAAAVVGGALAGGVATGSVEGALWGAFSGAVFFGIGQAFGGLADPAGGGVFNTGLRKSQFALQSVSHGLAGGTIAEMQGGKFGHGFLSAGVSKVATPGVGANIDGTFRQGFVMAIVGGTTSEISGGKFSNGAVTAAMAFAFAQAANGERTNETNMQDDSDLPAGVTRGDVDPNGPLSHAEARTGMRNAWFETFSGTEYAREQGGWIVRPRGIRGFFRSLFGRPEVYVARAPSGSRSSINLGPRPRFAIGKFHTHPGRDGVPVGSSADLNNRVPSYVIGSGGVTRINLSNTQNYLGTREDVLRP